MKNNKLTKNELLKKYAKQFLISLAVTLVMVLFLVSPAAASSPSVSFDFGAGTEGASYGTIDLLMFFTLLALLPSVLVMMTSFTRIIIVLSLTRSALGTQQTPPNQALIGIALFLTLFIMQPVLTEINTVAYTPYKNGDITQAEFLQTAVVPLKRFMLKQTYTNDIELFVSISKDAGNEIAEITSQEDLMDLGLEIVVPSFITSELKRAFNIGFLLFVPFLIIDIVVSSTLMSMGMVMLPPSTIALPFKIMMFVMVDGWGMLFGTLVKSFN